MSDVYVQQLFYAFACNQFVCMTCMGLSVVTFFEYHTPYVHTPHGITGAAAATVLGYGLLCLGAWHKGPRVIAGALLLFTVSLGFLAGLLCTWLDDLIFLVVLLVSFAQSLVMILYTKISPRTVDLPVAWVAMLSVTALMWAMTHYTQNWGTGINALLAGLTISVYNVLYMHRCKGLYDTSWRDRMTACARYYTELPIWALSQC